MAGVAGPRVESVRDLEVYTDTYNSKYNINTGVGLSSTRRSVSKTNDAFAGEIGGSKAIIFDGTNDSIDFSPSVSIAHNQPWTFSVWMYIGNSSSRHRRNLICTRGVADTAGYITYYYDSTTDANGNQITRIRFLVREERTTGGWGHLSLYPGPYGDSYVLTSLQDAYWCNQWHHFVLRKEASRYDIYMDGVYRTGTTRPTSYVNNGLDANSFGGNGRYAGWYGGLSAPKIHRRALSATQIANQYKRFKKRYNR